MLVYSLKLKKIAFFYKLEFPTYMYTVKDV